MSSGLTYLDKLWAPGRGEGRRAMFEMLAIAACVRDIDKHDARTAE